MLRPINLIWIMPTEGCLEISVFNGSYQIGSFLFLFGKEGEIVSDLIGRIEGELLVSCIFAMGTCVSG